MKTPISQLMELGLSEYEAKGYVSLLKEYPSTAYELGKTSGIPTSKIYEVLKKLTGRGMVTVIAEGKSKRYLPIALEDFLSRHKKEMETVMQSVRENLSEKASGRESISIWNIVDYDFLIEKAGGMIDGASHTVLISIWKEELERIEDKVRDALDRGVKVAILHFGNSRLRLGKLYQHPIEDTVFQEKGGRCFTVVADSKEVLMGTVLKYGIVEGAWSRNRSFITMAEEYVKHDIYIMKIITRFDRLLKERFGIRYEKLRDIFTDKEVQ